MQRSRSLLRFAAVVCAASAAAVCSGQSIITTVAGGGVGDGGAATAAMLGSPSSVVSMYNPSTGGVVLYIADTDNNRVRRVDEGGIITTVAGTGSGSFSGNNVAATAASLSSPTGLCVLQNSSSGGMELYIADKSSLRVRRVDEGGTITTVAGTGVVSFNSDGIAATAANLWFPTGASAVVNASSGGIVLYIADRDNHRIRRVDESGNISTAVGTGASGFNGDGRPAKNTLLRNPEGVSAVINASTGVVILYIVDTWNYRIRRVEEMGNVSTVAGTGTYGYNGDNIAATAASLSYPSGMCTLQNVTSGGVVLYIADTGNHRIRRVDEEGIITSVAGGAGQGFGGDGGAATAAQLNSPYSVSSLYNA
ncbi:MAG: hypothetical protein EOO65_05490, partial [Methanosarcinales archaeon]